MSTIAEAVQSEIQLSQPQEAPARGLIASLRNLFSELDQAIQLQRHLKTVPPAERVAVSRRWMGLD